MQPSGPHFENCPRAYPALMHVDHGVGWGAGCVSKDWLVAGGGLQDTGNVVCLDLGGHMCSRI